MSVAMSDVGNVRYGWLDTTDYRETVQTRCVYCYDMYKHVNHVSRVEEGVSITHQQYMSMASTTLAREHACTRM